MKRIRIFISSVQSEFAEERAMLCHYIRTDVLLGKFFEPFIFEEVPANEYPTSHVYLKEVEQCDIYLGLYGNLYGYEDEEGVSPTEREYDLAATLHKSRLIYIKSIGEEKRHPKETALIRKVERDIVRKTFVDIDGLRTSVYASLIRYLEEKEYIRWRPFDASNDNGATLEDLDEDKMKKLVTFLQNFGYTMHMQGGQEIRPKEVQKLLDKIEGTPEEAMISRLALRSMKQARYSPDNDGHFGLATQYYTHFTSPIRRYPDLQIHRIIKDNLRGRMNDAKRHHYEKILPEVAMETSSLERRADEAERETLKLKKVQYMRNFFGQEFEGVISGITKWGIYVELPNTVEGLVHVTNMTDDHYDYDEEHYQMIGSHIRKTYKLGQKVRVKMIDCDEISRTIDFRLVKERKEEREDG